MTEGIKKSSKELKEKLRNSPSKKEEKNRESAQGLKIL